MKAKPCRIPSLETQVPSSRSQPRASLASIEEIFNDAVASGDFRKIRLLILLPLGSTQAILFLQKI